MGFLIDIITICILALSIFIGYKKGLIGVIFKIFTFFIALIITFVLYIPVSNYIIQNTDIDEKIESSITQKFSFEGSNNENNETLNIQDYIMNYTSDAANSGIETISKQLAIMAIQFITAIGLFLITKLFLLIFRTISDVLSDLPLIKQFNEMGGLIYGLIKGMLIIYIILAIIYLLAPTMNNQNIIDVINGSFITNLLFEYNILLILFF